MTENLKKTKTGWPIPEAVKEAFVDFCARMGAIAQEDCAGALFLWQHMPPQIREWAKLDAKGSPAMDADFWDGLTAGLASSLRGHNEIQSKKRPKKGQDPARSA